ncbi:SAM-dependent methyltransferase [Saccharopolyspora sp. NPDC000995]
MNQPNSARIYDFLPGGSHNFEVDRQAAQTMQRARTAAEPGGNRGLLGGCAIADPGVVPVPLWHPDRAPTEHRPTTRSAGATVADVEVADVTGRCRHRVPMISECAQAHRWSPPRRKPAVRLA